MIKTFIRIFTKHFLAIIALSLLIFIGLACNFTSDSDWKRELGSKKLTMAKTSGSISDRVDIWFCASGEYAMRTQFSGFSGGGGSSLSMADEDFEQGTWTVESGMLILNPQNGKNHEYSISAGMDSNVIKLDGRGYLVSGHNECGN